MCGVVGIVADWPVNQAIYDALTVLQHRGQDAAGIATVDQQQLRLRKANGLVKDVFQLAHMQRLQGNIGIGHVRYPTAGSASVTEAQPFYVNSPFGIAFAHNGNLTNSQALAKTLFVQCRRHINTHSDSEVLLNMLAYELDQFQRYPLLPADIFAAVASMQQKLCGAYACVSLIIGHGLLAFRDPLGIRPLIIGRKKRQQAGQYDYMVASESVALDSLGFEVMRDVAPGEAIYISEQGQFYSQQCAQHPRYAPCLFEYVYFARPDSVLDKISVYSARVRMGVALGNKIAKEWSQLAIDVVIPIPETSCDIALAIAQILDKPYRQGFVKNRYVGRTFIMPEQATRQRSVRRKLNTNKAEFKDKSVLLVDDSIVRGTTSQQIVAMAREAGAKRVYFASAAPEIRFPNVYGIDTPSSSELIAHGRDVEEINRLIGADGLIFQSLDDLVAAVREDNPSIELFECSVFTGDYLTQDIDQGYLDLLADQRFQQRKAGEQTDDAPSPLVTFHQGT